MPTPKRIIKTPMIILDFIFLYGLLNAINQRIMWKVFESWKSTKEPTDNLFISPRIAGVVVMIIVLGLCLFQYLMSRQ